MKATTAKLFHHDNEITARKLCYISFVQVAVPAAPKKARDDIQTQPIKICAARERQKNAAKIIAFCFQDCCFQRPFLCIYSLELLAMPKGAITLPARLNHPQPSIMMWRSSPERWEKRSAEASLDPRQESSIGGSHSASAER